MNPVIRVQNLSKWFHPGLSLGAPWKKKPKIRALHQVNLEIPSGTLFVLVGPNGAGKTTLLKILSGLMLPDEGEVVLNGHLLTQEADPFRHSATLALADGRNFYWRLTARQNLEFFAALYNLSQKEAKRKIPILARRFDLEASLDRPYEQLSTGIRQRLVIARAFLNDEPSVLLMDEPTRSMDPLAKIELKAFLKDLAREGRKTVLVTTHDLSEAEEWADTIGILHEGRLVEVGTPEELGRLNPRKRLEETFAELCRKERVSIGVS